MCRQRDSKTNKFYLTFSGTNSQTRSFYLSYTHLSQNCYTHTHTPTQAHVHKHTHTNTDTIKIQIFFWASDLYSRFITVPLSSGVFWKIHYCGLPDSIVSVVVKLTLKIKMNFLKLFGKFLSFLMFHEQCDNWFFKNLVNVLSEKVFLKMIFSFDLFQAIICSNY